MCHGACRPGLRRARTAFVSQAVQAGRSFDYRAPGEFPFKPYGVPERGYRAALEINIALRWESGAVGFKER